MNTNKEYIEKLHQRTSNLIKFSLKNLPEMMNGDLLCFERTKNKATAGNSFRYTIISLIGICKAQKAGYKVPLNIAAIYNAVLEERERRFLNPGDLGLLLWLDVRMGGKHSGRIFEQLIPFFDEPDGLSRSLGMEIAWVIIGLAYFYNSNPKDKIQNFLKFSLDCLLNKYMTSSGLFRHYGSSFKRARFPNFATQIYCILALAVSAKILSEKRLLLAATQAADQLITYQLDDGGWPWLFDIKSGKVVERYELYSVHQDAMAPMALLELYELTGKSKYADSSCKGLDWIYGSNELRQHMCDERDGLIYRSIRRKKPFNRLFLYLNLITTIVFNKGDLLSGSMLEVNKTCRPYHLGWILEAWCGREYLLK